MNTTAEKLFDLIEKGVSPYQVVEEAEKRLKEAGFEKLEFHTAWGLTGGKSYYMIHHGTTLIAFTIPKTLYYRESFRMAAAHTDFPCLRIKPNPEMEMSAVECRGVRWSNLKYLVRPSAWNCRKSGTCK